MKKIKINPKYIVLVGLLVLIYIGVFLMPESQEKFSLNPEIEGEYWRWGSYQFAHLNWSHLIQNIVTLGLVSFIALELRTKFTFFSINYFLAGLVAVLPLWIISPFVALGASVAIFSSFGLVSPDAKQFNVKVWMIILAITAFIFIKPILILVGASGEKIGFAMMQALAHFSGFAFGLMGFYVFKGVNQVLTKRKQHVLRRIK